MDVLIDETARRVTSVQERGSLLPAEAEALRQSARRGVLSAAAAAADGGGPHERQQQLGLIADALQALVPPPALSELLAEFPQRDLHHRPSELGKERMVDTARRWYSALGNGGDPPAALSAVLAPGCRLVAV